MFKNVATKIALFFVDTATSAPKTGDAANLTAYVAKDYGTLTALTDTSATEISSTNAPGWYLFDVAQAETNADALLFTGKSSTSGVACIGQLIFTRPNLFSSMSIDASGSVKIQTNLKRGTAITGRHVLMVDTTTGVPQTGKTVSVTRSKGTGAFAAATPSTCTEISDGIYYWGGSSGDTDDAQVTFKFDAAGCRTVYLMFVFEP